ncbi:MAG: N-acetylmuramoyl-L-alanine amidase [Oscillospiraceae bacterium]
MNKFFNNITVFAALFTSIIAALSLAGLFDGDGKSTAANYTETSRNRAALIIDAGHGGADGGAVSASGTCESELNLDISLKLEQIMGLYGIPSVMTRSTEEIQYPDSAQTISAKKKADQRGRLELIKSTDNAVLISIHQNKYTSTGPHGTQVLYAPTEGSEAFSDSMQTALKEALRPDRERQVAQIQKSIYLMNNIDCPALLIECGFLSNPADEKLLKTEEYRLKIASAVAAGYIAAMPDLELTLFGGTNES